MSEFLPKIQAAGPLGRDPDFGQSRNGKDYCRLSVAVAPYVHDPKVPYDERPPAWWLTLWVFDQEGVEACQALKKGDRISFIGSLKRTYYTDRDNNRREQWQVSVKGFQVVGVKEPYSPPSHPPRGAGEYKRREPASASDAGHKGYAAKSQSSGNKSPGNNAKSGYVDEHDYEDDIPF